MRGGSGRPTPGRPGSLAPVRRLAGLVLALVAAAVGVVAITAGDQPVAVLVDAEAPAPAIDPSTVTPPPPPPPPTPTPTPTPPPPPVSVVAADEVTELSGPGVEAVAATAIGTDGVLEAWATLPTAGVDAGPAAWNVPLRNEFGGRLHVLVVEQEGPWLRVHLPVRPNGTEGWVRRGDVELRPVTNRIEIDVAERTLRVVDDGHEVFRATVVVGRPSDPTPTGRFYLRDSFAWDATSVYGAFVMPLSAYSETIAVINGGEAVVAIHGTNRPDRLGAAVSLGCIRLHNDAVTALAQLVAPGTPVLIHA